jgi:membrane protein DedA with SNARE-associated domain
MPFWRFTVLSTLGIIPWVIAFAYAGKGVGDRWDVWQEKLHYADYVVLASIAIFVLYLLVRRRRRSGPDAEPSAEPAADSAQ